MIRPLPGVDLPTLRTVLQEARNGLPGAGQYGLDAYTEWVNREASGLVGYVAPRELARLVQTPQWATILSAQPSLAEAAAIAEVNMRRSLLDDELKSLKDLEQSWRCSAAVEQLREAGGDKRVERVIVADTNFWVHWPKPIQEVDWKEVLGTDAGTDTSVLARIVIPAVVLDELDNLKSRGRDEVKVRARGFLRHFRSVISKEGSPPIDGEHVLDPAAGTTIRLLFDEPGHLRLPINDDEIADRADFVRWLVGEGVKTTVVSGDYRVVLRAQHLGLDTCLVD